MSFTTAKSWFLITTLSIFAWLVAVTDAAAVTLNPGDILVASGFGSTSAVIRVNPSTGAQDVVSSGENFSSILTGIALEPSGQILVVDPCTPVIPCPAGAVVIGGAGAVIRVDPGTGAQTIVSSGGLFMNPWGITIAANGDLLIVDRAFGGSGGIIRVNPTTGAQTMVSSGGYFVSPTGIALDSAGQILVADPQSVSGAIGGTGAIIRVDPTTGAQTVITSGSPLVDPLGLAFDALTGQIFVGDQSAGGPSFPGAIFRVDPVSGAVITVSSGGSFQDPTGVAVDAAGQILVAEQNGNFPVVFRVDPVSGMQTVVSSAGSSPYGITVVPVVISCEDQLAGAHGAIAAQAATIASQEATLTAQAVTIATQTATIASQAATIESLVERVFGLPPDSNVATAAREMARATIDQAIAMVGSSNQQVQVAEASYSRGLASLNAGDIMKAVTEFRQAFKSARLVLP